MSYLYSPTAGGFYLQDVSTSIPDDAVTVSTARHDELMAAQSRGAAIAPSARTGNPIIEWPKNDVETRRVALRRTIKREAARRILEISPEWRQLNDLRDPSDAGAVRFAQINALREASNEIERLLDAATTAQITDFPVKTSPLWPIFQEAI